MFFTTLVAVGENAILLRVTLAARSGPKLPWAPLYSKVLAQGAARDLMALDLRCPRLSGAPYNIFVRNNGPCRGHRVSEPHDGFP